MENSESMNDRKRITAESAEHIRNAHASCVDGRNHVKSSREAIARSFEVLNETSRRIAD
jgi:hypothetical protein